MFDANFHRWISRLMLAASDTLITWHERGIERRRLRSLGERGLKDLALSRCDAEREACKPCWRA